MAVWVSRPSCMVPGKDPLQLPFLTGDGRFPIVCKYGLSILPDTATGQSLPISDLAQKMEQPICFPGKKVCNNAHPLAMGAWRSSQLVIFGGIWVIYRVDDKSSGLQRINPYFAMYNILAKLPGKKMFCFHF